MSPEQAMGEREITARSDVYALGCVTYEMLTGDPPFTGSTAQAIVAKVMTDEPMPPRRHRKTVPEAVEAAVLTALEKLPADRFPSAVAFAEALSAPTVPVRVAAAAPARGWLADRRSWAAVAVAGVSVGAAAALWVKNREHAGDVSAMSAVQNTFRQEPVMAARWAPEGATIIYSAAHGGSTPRLYLVRPDYPEPQAIGPDSVQLLAVSSKGELAVLTHAVSLGHRLYRGTLASMPLGGGAPREIMNDVREADWSPDGSRLAITRASGDRYRLEYPAGRLVYQGQPGGYLSEIRTSARGDRIALFSHDLAGDDRGFVVVVDTAGVADTLGSEFWGLQGLAWNDARSVVFSAASKGGQYQVHRAELGGVPRLALPSAGSLTLMDAARGNRWLVSRDDAPLWILVKGPGTAPLRDLSWLDNSLTPSLSPDGALMAFTDQSTAGGNQYSVMLRKTDGSPVVRLGPGGRSSISRDGRLVIAQLPSSPSKFMLYPTGAGDTRPLAWPQLEQVTGLDFFPDSRSLLVCGNEPRKPTRCYRSPLEGGTLEPIGPDSIAFGFLRPDGRAMAVPRGTGRWIYPLDGGTPVAVPGLGDTVGILRWSPDGRALWVLTGSNVHPKVDQVDVATGRRTSLIDVEPPAGLTVFGTFNVSVADDPRTYAYSAWSYNSELFTIQGVR
jgi:Tol biopolymer transport system component